MSSSVRQFITEQLAPHLPETWKVEPGIPTLETFVGPMLWLEYTSFAPLPEAPKASFKVGADLCIVTSKTDLRKGEAEADELALALFGAVYAAQPFYEITVNKAVFGDVYLGWRLSVAVVTSIEQPEGP